MLIKARMGMSADGFVATPEGVPTLALTPGFIPAASHGYPEFIEGVDAVVMGRNTFVPALGSPDWPWPGLAVYVLTYSRELANDLPPTGMTNWRRSQQHALHTTWTAVLHDSSVAFECRFLEADSVDGGLLRVAEDEDVDVIVLGTHKSARWTGRALGTVAGRVAHRSHCPTVLVPGT